MQAQRPPGDRLPLPLGLGALLLLPPPRLFRASPPDVVTNDRLTVLDAQVAQWLHRHATPPLTRTMLVFTDLHSTVAVGCYSALVAVALALRRQWRRLTLVVAAVAGGLALNVLMKLAFHRARPVFDD